MIGPIDDDRVDVGNVQAALDDGGAHQHIAFAVGKVEHHLLQLALWHLPMADADARFGHDVLHALRQLLDAQHPVVYKVDLPCLLYTSPSPRDRTRSRMPSSA